MMSRISGLALAIGAILLCASVARAENEGQDDLDSATEKKLAADSVDDLSQVITLCESALKKGLDTTNAQFAKNMLTGTLMQRATFKLRRLEGPAAAANFAQTRKQVLEDLDKALENDPKLAAAYLMRAQLYMLPDGRNPPQIAEALKSAELALENSKDEVDEQIKAIRLLAALTTDADKKAEWYERAKKIAPNNVELLAESAEYYRKQGKTELALKDIETAIKNEPDIVDLRLVRAACLLALKRTDDAAAAFGDAIRLAPDNPTPYLFRAELFAKEKKFEQALEDANRVLEMAPNNRQVVLFRAKLNMHLKKSDEALSDINHVLEIDPKNVEAFLLRAQVQQLKGDLDAARADIDTVLKIRPALAEALAMRASISASSGDYSQSIEDLESLAKIAPKNAPLQVQLGMLYALNKQPRKAVEKYSAALAIDPGEFSALRGRADSNLNVGKHAEAVTDYEAAMKLKPDDTGVLNNLAWVLATSPEDTVRNGKRSVELGTKAAEKTEFKQAHILSTLAAGYAEAGDFEKAKEWSQKAVGLGDEDSETASQLKKELASYEEKKPWREKQIIEENEDGGAKPKSPQNPSAQKEPAAVPDKDASAAKGPPARPE